jgi:xylose isomerase
MKYSAILGNLSNTCDRFLSSGYKDQPSKEEMFKRAASIPEVTGIELVGTWDIDKNNVKLIKSLLQEHNLQCVSIIPDHFGQKIWGSGSFTSRNADIRKLAVSVTKEMIDIAEELGCPLLNLWPGQDGYDYLFQGDFIRAHDYWIEAIRECANYKKDIKISLEYKPKEPRTHSYIARAADTLLLVRDINRENVGVTIDFGHALYAGENVAESAVMLAREGKLFHMHFNDNYRSWDDDMIVGSIHTLEYIELLYWLRKMNYIGWYSMDLYPYREDAREAISESIEWLKTFEKWIGQYGMDKIDALINEGSATQIVHEMQKLITNGCEQTFY